MYLANFDDYKYFSKDEFKCSHTGNCLMEKDFMDQLTILRQKINRPFIISSGYRDPSHPIEAKKKKPGQHTKGNAVDLLVNGPHAYEIIKEAMAMGVFKGIGFQQKGNHSSRFIHLDTRDDPAVWSY